MAFLLRLWCVKDEDGIVWRASLEDAHTGERRGFADVQLLYVFLEKQIIDATSDAPPLLGETS
jgi:hypothetical protein